MGKPGKNSFMNREKARWNALIRKWDDPILKQNCEKVTESDLESIGKVINDLMMVAQYSDIPAAGLAAPQVGSNKRIIYICCREIVPIIMINPEITWFSPEVDTREEGCLSFPGITAAIIRSRSINVKWQELTVYYQNSCAQPSLISKERKFEGFPARVIQHEVDHIFGVCLIGDQWLKTRKLTNVTA